MSVSLYYCNKVAVCVLLVSIDCGSPGWLNAGQMYLNVVSGSGWRLVNLINAQSTATKSHSVQHYSPLILHTDHVILLSRLVSL